MNLRPFFAHSAAASRLLCLRRRRGFTLIELMITVAIVGVLAAIAYPSYQDSVLKGRRAEGRTALLNLLQQQERYYTQTGSYLSFSAGASGSNGATASANSGVSIPFKTTSGDSSTSFAYQLKAEACSSTLALTECILLSAVPQRTDADVGTLTLMSTGVKSCVATGSSPSVSPAKPSICWR